MSGNETVDIVSSFNYVVYSLAVVSFPDYYQSGNETVLMDTIVA